ncbi:condensation domain-containing protein, partial [Streptomyces fagopyri]|uniref:condensation domain-containing protein n=1 Tax=Streptomyces fagopyri TaxID=2662397 RepID=UPI00381A08EB
MMPASFAQRRLWFLNQIEGGSTYNLPLAFRLSGTLDEDALRDALADLTARHESLRTRITDVDGEPVQDILPAGSARPLLQVTETTEAELNGLMTEVIGTGFDLAVDLPLRGELFAVAPDEWVLVLVVHHIACDGWSMGPLWRDLSVAYEARCAGRAPSWEPLPVQYADYALWQTELLGEAGNPGSVLAGQLAYWRGALAGLPEELALPLDRPRPATASHRGSRTPVVISAATHAGLARLARQRGVTMFMLLQTAVAVVLSRLGAGTDVPIGTPVAGRTDEQLDDLVGFFVNTLVLRTDLSGDPTFTELLDRVRETCLTAFEHQDVPFERLVEELAPARSMARHPLFQVMVAVQNTDDSSLQLPGIQATPLPETLPAAKFDLDFEFRERFAPNGEPAGLEGRLVHAVELFDGESVGLVVERLVRVLEAVVADPGVR